MRKVPAFRLVAEPLTDEAAHLLPFKWAEPEVGKRHRLGGEAAFVAFEDYPLCHQCGEVMSFYGQLDSINDDYVLADAGLILVFVCFDCFESISFIRSS
jgi:hypothetical protein